MKNKLTAVFLICMMFALQLYAKEKTEKKTPEEEAAELAEDMTKYYSYEDKDLKLIIDYTEPGKQHDLAKEIYENRQKIYALKKEITNLEIYLGNLLSSSGGRLGDIGEQKQKELDKKKAEVAARKEAQDLLKKGTINSIDDYLESKYAITSGDPVKITTGSYVQNETDIKSTSLEIFKVSRDYDSNSRTVSSFGLGWTTNLDQRIILGIEPFAHERYEEENRLNIALKEEINQIEINLISIYKVSGLKNGVKELEDRIADCEKYEGRFKTLISDSSGMGSYETTAKNLYETYKEKLKKLKDDLKDFKDGLVLLKEKQDDYEKRKSENEIYYNEVVKKSDLRKENNKYVVFPGMDVNAECTGLNTITVIDGSGYSHLLYETETDSGIWKGKVETQVAECRTTKDGYRVFFYDGISNEYDKNGLLIKISDRNANEVSIKRNNGGKIQEIFDSNGEKYTINYKGNYIETIKNECASDFVISYTYDSNKLKTVTDEDGDTVTMEYYENGRLYYLKKCDGSKIVFTYGEVTKDDKYLTTKTMNEEGFEEHFEYDKDGKSAVYTDHDGNKTVYEYDERHRTTKEYRPDGTCVVNEYDKYGQNPVRVTENGNKIDYEYDARGNKTKAIYHSNGSEEKWTYDSFNQITSYKDRDGVLYEYIRDERGNLIEYLSGGKRVYRQEVNAKGQVKKRTVYGQNDIVTEYEYYNNGNLEYQICDGVKTEYEYDGRNRVTKITVAGKVVTEYEYIGRNVIQRDYNGLETTYVTNGRKDMTDVIQKDTVTGIIHKTRIEYDRRHLPLRVYAGDGEAETLVTSYLYTPEGKIKAQVSHGKENWITLYEYENGEIHEVKQFKTPAVVEPVETTLFEALLSQLLIKAGEDVYIQKYDRKIQGENQKRLTVTDGRGIQTFFEYDSNGNLVKTTDGNNETRSIAYTKAGRLNGEQSSHGGWYRYEYEGGNLWKAGEESGAKIESTYFADGSQRSVKDRYGRTTNYNYDNRGRVSSIQSETQKTWYEYDSFDRVTKEVIGNTPDEYSALYYVTYEYSDDGRTVIVTEGGKYKSVSELDAFGNVIKQTDGNGNTRRYEYNSLSQVTKSYDGYENETNYEYNALGNVSLVAQPDGSKTEYKYNYMGLLYKVTDDCGTVYTASYDKAGRLVKEKSRSDSEKSYKYDNGGRITEVLCGGEVVESYDYGKDSRTVTVKDGKGEDYIYNYDAYGRLTDEINRKGLSQSYIYDSDGQMNGQTNFDGSTTTIVYSENRTVRTVKYSDGNENRFVYDSIGNIIDAQNAYGKTLYSYDQGGRMVYQKDVTTGEEIRFYYDDAGNRTKLLSSNRETIYTYGKNSEVKEIFDNKQRLSVKLEYDKNGREVLRKFGNGTSETTLYDKAGRVTVKAQKSDRGELQWAEGYLYGEDGKRTATVDNQGRVTLYEYNKKGQLEIVYYPYSQKMINSLKEEAQTNGLSVTTELGENRYLPSEIKNSLVPLMNSMKYGLAYNLTNLQIFIKESYGYDKNGNRTSKTTNYGTINYNYDRENCLVSSGSGGKNFVSYTYDSMGNLLTEESALKSTKYAYTSQNRLFYCEVTDKSNREYAQTSYAYDAFGRRVLVQDKGEASLRTLYDGLSFEVIKQSPTFENGLFTDSQNTGIQWGKTGKPTGNRYRYIGDEESKNDGRYVYLDENAYRIKNTRYTGERTQITVNGTVAAQSSSEGTQYYTTDLFGSVSSISDSSGYQIGSYTYDAFGSLIQGDLTGVTDFGYLGKQNDPTSRLYNYGYRDYKPEAARFTTVDPVRDGTNWFAYVNNDPVNFVDLWGLCKGSDKEIIYTAENPINQIDFDKRYGFYDPDRKTQSCKTNSLINLYAYDYGVKQSQLDAAVDKWKKGGSIYEDGSPHDLNVMSIILAKEIGCDEYYSFVYPKPEQDKLTYESLEDFENSIYPAAIIFQKKPEHKHYTAKVKARDSDGNNITKTIDSLDPNRSGVEDYTIKLIEPLQKLPVSN